MLLLGSAAASHAAPQVGSSPYRASATGAGNSHSPVFSADGKHIAFVSHANNLATNDDIGPHLDLFVRDLVNSNTVLVSVSTNGFGGADDNIGLYTLSSNAQVIAFDTAASNLGAWDNNRASDIYVQDLLFGGRSRVTWSAGDEGDGNANGPSYNPLISEDGRYVIFESLASNLVTNDFNGTNDIFIHDLETGVTELVSVNAEGTASPDGPSHSPSISANGLLVAFASRATNLVTGVTNQLDEIYVRDIAGRSNLWAQASHLSGTHSRGPASGALEPYHASEPVLSADGRYVAFKTQGQTVRFDLHRTTNSVILVFTNRAVFPPLAVHRFDDNPRLAASAADAPLAFSSDGRYLFYSTKFTPSPVPHSPSSSAVVLLDFESLETNWIYNPPPGGTSGGFPYYATNVVPQAKVIMTNIISGSFATWTQLPWVGLGSDVSRVFFLADGTNLVFSPAIRTVQLYGFDLPNGPVRLISINRDANPGRDLSAVVPSLSPNGSLIAWDNPDDNIVLDDLNRAWDVFVRNVDTGGTRLISSRDPELPAASGIALSRLDLNPGAISANGQRLAILSLDSTLVANDTNLWRDVVVRDLVTGTNFDVSRSIGRVPFSSQTNFPGTNAALSPVLSADGRYVAFAGESLFTGLNTNRAIYWRDLQTSSNHVIVAGNPNTSSGNSLSSPVLSPDGRFLAFHSQDSLVPFFPDGNNSRDVFVYQMIASNPPLPPWCSDSPCEPGLNILGGRIASRTPSGNAVANGPSINPAFAPDSYWLLFQSLATDLTDQAITSPSRHQLYARGVGSTNAAIPPCPCIREVRAFSPTRLISYNTTASTGPNGISTDLPLPGGGANPRFSADSRYVAFESSPNLIYRHDLLNDWVTKIVTHADPWFSGFTNRARFTNDLVCSNCFNPTLNTDGRYVAYETLPAPGGIRGISVKDLQTGQEESISVSLTGINGNGPSSTPLISHDARFIVFASRASDLAPGDNNRATDIFVRDRLNRVTHCLSRNWAGTGTGNRISSNPILSADGRTVAFQSFASDLVPGDYNDTRDVFVVTLAGPDTDGDGMDDDWEMAYFSTLDRNGSGDFDSDGASDLAEFRAGTNPVNDASILRVLQVATAVIQDSAFFDRSRKTVLLWSAVPGRTYRLEWRPTVSRPWETVGADTVATGVSASASHTIDLRFSSDYPYGFYRVLLVQ